MQQKVVKKKNGIFAFIAYKPVVKMESRKTPQEDPFLYIHSLVLLMMIEHTVVTCKLCVQVYTVRRVSVVSTT